MQTYTAKQLLSPSHSTLLEEIVLLIAHSFTEDPNTKWIFNNYTRAEYISVLPAYFRFITKAALLSGATITIIHKDKPEPTTLETTTHPPPQEKQDSTTVALTPTSTIRALGVLIPSSDNQTFESTWTYLRAGLLTLPFHCGFHPIYKVFTQIAGPMHKLQDTIFPDPDSRHGFWQLLFLATHPDSQGQGLGKKILAEFQGMVKKAGEESGREECVYLEASSRGSQRLYQRVGFVDRGNVPYGECIGEGGDVIVSEEGKVTGARMFGMTWSP